MNWMLISIVALLTGSMIWAYIAYIKNFRKNRGIFNEYLKKQRRIKFNNSGGVNNFFNKENKLARQP